MGALILFLTIGQVESTAAEISSGSVVIVDEKYRTACGPISAFVAFRSLGVPASLQDMVRNCNWTTGKMSSLQEIHDAINVSGEVESIATRLTPPQLCNYLASPEWVAILPVRKGNTDINHAVCAVDAKSAHVVLIDYPELRMTVPLHELTDVWDGQVLLVRRVAHWKRLRLAGWLLLPSLAFLGFAIQMRTWIQGCRANESLA